MSLNLSLHSLRSAMFRGCSVTFIVTLMAFSVYSREVPQPLETNQLLSMLASGQGLYSNETKVVVLNATNFRSTVYNTKNSWFIEFYNSWCGHCQRFAPTWSALAADVYGWKDVVKIAAINCAVDDNNPLCRDYEIMHYPALRFFSSESNAGQLGTEIDKRDTVDGLRHVLMEILKKEQIEGRGSSWPNITPYRSNDVQNLWKNAPDSLQYTLLIFEDTESDIGLEVVLDLSPTKEIQVRTVSHQNEALVKLIGVLKFPSIVALQRDLTISTLRVKENTREGFLNAIKQFLKSRNIIIVELEKDDVQSSPTKQLEQPGGSAKTFDNIVYQVDLENTIKYSLKNEIPLHKVISGDAFVALKDYLKVLAKYFPTDQSGVKFLERLRDRLSGLYEIEGEHFYELVEKLQSEYNPAFLATDGWIGCKGSDTRYRGYPCGLWTTFHMLTTNAVLKDGTKASFNSLEVLNAVLGYVTHFFGCHDCSQHFQEMARKSMRTDVTGPDESILWLWNAHNSANERLAGDLTEDPHHHKIQFPSKESCPACRSSDGRWVNKQVLTFLKQMYNPDNVNHMKVSNSDDTKLNLENLVPETLESMDSGVTIQKKRISWNFNIFDISLCVMLYFCSAVILILVFIKFVVRKRYRKKLYIHDILGKV